jgi:hypothetical protein
MTHNVLDDGSFRPTCRSSAAPDPQPQGQGGRRQQAVIDKLVEVGGLLARGRSSIPTRIAGAPRRRDLPQHAAMVRRHRPDGGRRAGRLRPDDPRTRADLHRQPGAMDAANRPQPALFDDRGAPRLGAVAPARLGRAADLFRAARRAPDDPDFLLRDEAVNARILAAFEAEGADAWYAPGAKARFLGNDYDPDGLGTGVRHPRRVVRFRLHPCFRAARPRRRVRRRARRPLPRRHRPASRLVPLLDAAGLRHDRARALSRRADPRLHARREGHEDVQIARQHRRPRGGGQSSTAPISCGSGWRSRTTPPICASGRKS